MHFRAQEIQALSTDGVVLLVQAWLGMRLEFKSEQWQSSFVSGEH